jgi:hypothetical protein
MKVSKDATNTTKPENASANNGARAIPQFVRYRLTEAELAQARNACLDMGDVGEVISQFVDEGYKFSASFDSYGGGIQVFVTPTPKNPQNLGMTLTARAPELRLAVGMLAFKHYTLFAQQWPSDISDRKGETWG